MVKTFFVVILFSIVLNAKVIAVAPLDIDYKNEDLNKIANEVYLLFDQLVNAYNLQQLTLDRTHVLNEIALPNIKNQTKIENIHKAVRNKDISEKLQRKNIDLLVIPSINIYKVVEVLRTCTYRCSFDLNVKIVEQNGKEANHYLRPQVNTKYNIIRLQSLDKASEKLFGDY